MILLLQEGEEIERQEIGAEVPTRQRDDPIARKDRPRQRHAVLYVQTRIMSLGIAHNVRASHGVEEGEFQGRVKAQEENPLADPQKSKALLFR